MMMLLSGVQSMMLFCKQLPDVKVFVWSEVLLLCTASDVCSLCNASTATVAKRKDTAVKIRQNVTV